MPGLTCTRRSVALFATAAAAALTRSAYGAAVLLPSPTPGASISLTPIASTLTAPIDLRESPDGTGRKFITQQSGQIRVVDNGVLQATPFLDVSGRLAPFRTSGGNITYDERGLLGFVFDPDYSNVGTPGFHKVYTDTSEGPTSGTVTYVTPASGTTDHHDVIAEWTVNAAGTAVDPTSRREIIRLGHPSFNHDAGSLFFGPDKLLYFADGDGGGANDIGNGHVVTVGNAQTTTAGNLLGKILRIDPHGGAGGAGTGIGVSYSVPGTNPFAGDNTKAQEIYAYGFRNVYRMSFDRGGTHDLIAADVGQNNVEEADRVTLGGNYGWHVKEGTFLFNSDGTVGANSPGSPAGLIDPLVQFDHTQGTAIVGGFVYRGSIMPTLVGKYVFGEYAGSGGIGSPGGRLFYADLATGQISEMVGGLQALGGVYIKGMGEDANGEIYVLTDTGLGPSGTAGRAFMIVPEPASLSLVALGVMGFLARRRRR